VVRRRAMTRIARFLVGDVEAQFNQGDNLSVSLE
jgi:hypothetical protein